MASNKIVKLCGTSICLKSGAQWCWDLLLDSIQICWAYFVLQINVK